ncbi:MAG: hypothetical protein RLZZ480_502 [Candidatus Parcubacteria bacterium]|jgi:hypothetical protein
MKKTFYIIGGIIIVILIAIWLFLLFANDSTKAEMYNRFGLSGSTEEGIIEDIIDTIVPDVFQKKYLRQLTTKRVIGYTEVSEASSTLVYFVEGGTGHVYTIDPMIEGSENRISNITVPVATEASLSPDGSRIAVRTGNQTDSKITILTKNGESFDSYSLGEKIRDFVVDDTGALLYTQVGGTGLFGKEFDIESKTAKAIFEVPFQEATIVWGKTAQGPHYVYPKTSRYLEGFLYQIQDGTFSRLPASGFGFSIYALSSSAVFSKIVNGKFTSYITDIKSGETEELPLNYIPEKCAFGTEALYCSFGGDIINDYDFPDNWYRGEISFTDSLWKTTVDTQSNKVVDMFSDSGREIDGISLHLGRGDELLYLINKNDHSLWVYEFPKQDTNE